MAFLTLLGFTIPTSTGSNGAIEPVRAGEYGRSFGLKPYSAVRAESRDYRGATPLMARRTSMAYQLLVAGQGEAFAFDAAGSGATTDYYSSKGLGPVDVEGTVASVATGGPVSNGGRLTISADGFVVWAMPIDPLEEATLSLWVKNSDTSGNWRHYAIEWSGSSAVAAWWNGSVVSPSGLTNNLDSAVFIGANSTTTTLSLIAIPDSQYAEVTYLPYRASLLRSDFASYMYNSGIGRAVEDLPYLSMGGTWVPPGDSSQTDTVLGEVMGQRLVDTVVSGSPVQYEAFDFTLRSRNVR